MDNAKRKTRGTIRVKIPHPLLHVLNTDITEKSETLQHLTTYCFFLDRNRFYLILYFDANPETSQYSSKKELSRLTETFVDFLEMNNSSTSNNTYSFPDRKEANTTMNNTLMSMLDDNTTKPPPTSSKKKTFYYAVSTGRTVGIFNDWAEAHASISGYSHAAHKRFETKEAAEQYLNNTQAFTPAHERTTSSYSNIARMRPDNHYSRRKPTNESTITDDQDSLYSKSTSSITLSTIRTECPEKHSTTLEMLISSGAGIETLKKVVSDWAKDSNTHTYNI